MRKGCAGLGFGWVFDSRESGVDAHGSCGYVGQAFGEVEVELLQRDRVNFGVGYFVGNFVVVFLS